VGAGGGRFPRQSSSIGRAASSFFLKKGEEEKGRSIKVPGERRGR